MKNIQITALIALVITLMICSPLAVIWALNTLFPLLSIGYTFWNWLAVAFLQGVFVSVKFRK